MRRERGAVTSIIGVSVNSSQSRPVRTKGDSRGTIDGEGRHDWVRMSLLREPEKGLVHWCTRRVLASAAAAALIAPGGG